MAGTSARGKDRPQIGRGVEGKGVRWEVVGAVKSSLRGRLHRAHPDAGNWTRRGNSSGRRLNGTLASAPFRHVGKKINWVIRPKRRTCRVAAERGSGTVPLPRAFGV